jgi:hypothetical protein
VTRLAIVVAAAVAVTLMLGASAQAADRYCSPTGDFCTSATRLNGAVFLRVATFSFRGLVRICVTGPSGGRVCRRFRLRARPNGLYEARVRWYRHYPNRGPGTYRVRFFTGTTPLGPVLTFRLRA